MGRRTSRSFTGVPTDPHEARWFAGAWLADATALPRDAEPVEDAELVVSELITNAVNNDAHQLELILSVEESRIQVSVVDDGTGWPTPQEPSLAAESGRGLRIVATLAETWGIEQLSGGCKRVWAAIEF